jgi:hypothetical protein
MCTCRQHPIQRNALPRTILPSQKSKGNKKKPELEKGTSVKKIGFNSQIEVLISKASYLLSFCKF